MLSAEEIAKSKAQASAIKAAEQEINSNEPPNVDKVTTKTDVSNTVGLTSFEDLTREYQTDIVKTPSGYTFLIQTIVPGDFVRLVGSPIVNMLIEKGVDISDADSFAKGIQEIPENEQINIVAQDDFLEMAKMVCCAGITSINFKMKNQDECDTAKKEVSIDRISLPDVIFLYTSIMNLSIPEAQVETVRQFRSDGRHQQEFIGKSS